MSWTITKEKVERFFKMWIVLSATVFPILYFLATSIIVDPLESRFKDQQEQTIKCQNEIEKISLDQKNLKRELAQIVSSKNYQNLVEIAEHLDKSDLKKVGNLVEEFDNHNKDVTRLITRLQYDIETLQNKDVSHDSYISNLFYGKEPKNSYLP